ncbi:glycoside hydrolase 5 family protein [Marinimicrobium sp. ARAG 43.8]|uniref:glycoside hydrolase 5 family protein n=1 Tax=Marinimicrobium sp. ARAG 43.8 TaxID=3418719 RepID=UPI003CEA398E
MKLHWLTRVYRPAMLLLMVSTFLGACATSGLPEGVAQNDFVKVEGRHFMLKGEPYYFVGTNVWYGAYLGSVGEEGNRERLIRELDLLKANGVTNLRMLALSENSELTQSVQPAVMEQPGQYNENLLKGLDFLLAEMAKRDMKAVLYFNNFWQWSGGMSQYVSWLTGDPVVDPDLTGKWNEFMDNSARFYRLPEAQRWYRDAIKTVVTRTNTINGRRYNEDPTVMSWQLANEPRPGSHIHGPEHFDAYKTWIHETAKYIHSLAPYQLVSTGSEGARGALDDIELFREAHASPYVDYLTFHMWLKNWGWFDIHNPDATYDSAMATATDYIDLHVSMANTMNKPIVLSEFGAERDEGEFEPGTTTQYRDRIYAEVFEQVYEHAAEGSAIAGTNFWAWGGYGRAAQENFKWLEGDDFTGDPPQEAQGLNSVFDTDDSTLSVIRGHAEKMHSLQ